MIIYKAQNKINGKVYIGQTTKSINERFKGHLKGKTFFDKALRKYGINNFDIQIIDSASCIDELNKKEEKWIRSFNCVVPNGYNILYGGKNSCGHHRSNETKEKLRLANTGKHLSLEARIKISVSSKERWKDEEYRKRVCSSRKGTVISEEQKKKISIANKGKRKGFVMSEEQKRKISESCKKKTLNRQRDKFGKFIKYRGVK